jgi:hypothetical protein
MGTGFAVSWSGTAGPAAWYDSDEPTAACDDASLTRPAEGQLNLGARAGRSPINAALLGR